MNFVWAHIAICDVCLLQGRDYKMAAQQFPINLVVWNKKTFTDPINRKPVFRVFDQVTLKPAVSATEAS